MKDEISPRSGILDCEQGSATFYEENYNFRIMNNAITPASLSNENFAQLVQENNYFHGILHDGKLIAIYLGNSSLSSIKSIISFHTNLYAIQQTDIFIPNWNKINAISFRGGTVNQLFSWNHIPYEIVDNSIKPASPQPAVPFIIHFGDIDITVSIGEMISQIRNQTEVSISGKKGYIDMKFSKPISFEDIQFHIDKVKTILSFMSFRCNVDFDEILLEKESSGTLWTFATVYSELLSTPTQKNSSSNICFNEFKSSPFVLFDLIYNESTNNPFSFINFIPEDDTHTNRMTNDMVKGIVTCLECEIARIKNQNPTLITSDNKSHDYIQEELRLNSLIKELQKTAKEFQKQNGKFSQKTTDMIRGTLNHMTLADADKIGMFYSQYQNFLTLLFSSSSLDFIPTVDDVNNLIVYRNKTTPGAQEVLDNRIIITARYLIGLIYCMVLHSIGFDDNDLQKLCMKHFLY